MQLTLVILSVLTFTTILIGKVNTKSCSAQWECSDVSSDYNYVKCGSAGSCECQYSQGFIGAASTTDKCRCDKTVFWQGGSPYCIDLVESAKLKDTFSRSLDYNGNFNTKLDWFAGGSYSISGTYQITGGPTGQNEYPATLYIDAEKKFIYLNHFNNVHYLWSEPSQVTGGYPFASVMYAASKCFISNYTSINQVENHKAELWVGTSINYQKIPVLQFAGNSFDVHTSDVALAGNNLFRFASFTEQTFDGIITHWTWDGIWNTFGRYARIPQSISFDINTLVRGTPPSVDLVPACTTPGRVYDFSEAQKSSALQIPLY